MVVINLVSLIETLAQMSHSVLFCVFSITNASAYIMYESSLHVLPLLCGAFLIVADAY